MKRFFLLITLLLAIFFSWPYISEKMEEKGLNDVADDIRSYLVNTDMKEALQQLYTRVTFLIDWFEDTLLDSGDEDTTELKKEDLKHPSQHLFSVHNIELGDEKKKVEAALGSPKRVTMNEYDTKWHTYHENYRNFVMVLYDDQNRVAGLYTNQDLISSTKGIKLGTEKDTVRRQLGSPLTKILKGNVYYEVDTDDHYDVFSVDESYVTVFYDKYENNTVTAIQILDKSIEERKQDFYGKVSKELMEGFEYQLFDLTNASRVNHGLQPLTWDEHVRQTARKHSADMAEQNYFGHTNLKGESPFDRMKDDNLVFTLAGENLAYGQFSSIFAHEGLMNSKGHRENILKSEFEYLGVGVAFNDQSQPFYTENFYAK